MGTEADLDWHRVAELDEIEEDEPLAVKAGDRLVAIYKVADAVYATENVCSHEFAMLSEGFVDGDVIECPLHAARFHIPSGKCLAPPADQDIETFPVRIEDGQVLVGLPSD